MHRTSEAVEAERALVLAALAESYSGPAWHGPSVREAVDGVDAHDASRTLGDGRNSIRGLVLHLAHGRHLLIERVTSRASVAFPRALREPWWPVTPADSSDEGWRADLALLDEYQRQLIAAVRGASAEQLERVPNGSTDSVMRQLLGMALHDAYHAGQIRLMALLQ